MVQEMETAESVGARRTVKAAESAGTGRENVTVEHNDYRAEILLSDALPESKKEQRMEQEARMTALRIRELVGNTMVTERRVNEQGETENVLRPASYRDIVILLRTSGDWFDCYRRVLEREGIPVYVATPDILRLPRFRLFFII